MKRSSVLWVAGFGLAAFCSISAPEYGQWNTGWIAAIPKPLTKVVPTLNNVTRVSLLQFDRFVNPARYRTNGQEQKPIAINGRDKGCISSGEGGETSAPPVAYKGFSLEAWSSFYIRGEAIVGVLDAKGITQALGTPAYCQLDKNTARWLPQFNPSGVLDIRFSEDGKLKGYKWRDKK